LLTQPPQVKEPTMALSTLGADELIRLSTHELEVQVAVQTQQVGLLTVLPDQLVSTGTAAVFASSEAKGQNR